MKALLIGVGIIILVIFYLIPKLRRLTSRTVLFFDTETTGVPKNYTASPEDTENWPRCVQLSWILYSEKTGESLERDFIIKPDGWEIPEAATKIHGITQDQALSEGTDIDEVLNLFCYDLKKANKIVGHNIKFDVNIVKSELYRASRDYEFIDSYPLICTMLSTVGVCKIPFPSGRGGYKWPKLSELYWFLFGTNFEGAHNSMSDIRATKDCYYELIKRGLL